MKKVGGYFLMKMLGKGTYTNVYLAKKTLSFSSKKFAIKQIRVENYELLQWMIREINVLFFYKHKNLVNVYEIFFKKNYIFIVMDYHPYTLENYVKKFGAFSEKDALNIFHQLNDVQQFLNFNNIAHRDIKPENILIDKNPSHPEGEASFEVFLIDFNLSKKFLDSSKRHSVEVVTYSYRPLELYRKNPKTKNIRKLDVWSMGCLLYYMIQGKELFGNNGERFVKSEIKDFFKDPSKVFDLFEEPTKSILSNCLQKKSKERTLPTTSNPLEKVKDLFWFDGKPLENLYKEKYNLSDEVINLGNLFIKKYNLKENDEKFAFSLASKFLDVDIKFDNEDFSFYKKEYKVFVKMIKGEYIN